MTKVENQIINIYSYVPKEIFICKQKSTLTANVYPPPFDFSIFLIYLYRTKN